MKTNPAARWIVKIRFSMICLAIVVLAVLDLGLGESLTARVGQHIAIRTEVSQAPNLSISDFLIAGAR